MGPEGRSSRFCQYHYVFSLKIKTILDITVGSAHHSLNLKGFGTEEIASQLKTKKSVNSLTSGLEIYNMIIYSYSHILT